MKLITLAKFIWLFLCIGLILAGANLIKAQTTPAKNLVVQKKTFQSLLSEKLRSKGGGSAFVLLTPNDLEKISTENSQGLAEATGPCDIAVGVEIGQTLGGALNNTDCQLDDGSWADFYFFSGTQGQQVRLLMDSSSIDSYLGLANDSGTFVLEDDDSGGGLSALITATLPETGDYLILANSALPNQFGGYTLRLSGPEPCAFTVSPTTTEIPAAGGTFTYNVNAPAGCYWQAFSQMQYATTRSAGIGPGTVTYTVSQNGSGSTRQGSIIVSTAPLSTLYTYFTITQPSVACTYSLNPPTVDIPATATSGSFQIVTQSGCPWSVLTGANATVSGSTSGTGTATINYSMPHNNGAARSELIWINGVSSGLTYRINQAGLNCTFSFTPSGFQVARQAAVRKVDVNTQPGCIWSATSASTFLTLQNNLGSGPGSVTFNVAALTDSQWRDGALQFWFGSAGSSSVWVDQSKNYSTKSFDFDADGRSDISIYRPGAGEWWYSRSSDNVNRVAQFGTSTDTPVPADYTGDGKTDVAFYRPATGEWFILRSEDSSYYSFPFGTAGDIAAPGDFDGDGITDAAVYRPSTGTWYIRQSRGETSIRQFGIAEDKPVVADYDRDGKDDIAIYRPSLGQWWIYRSFYQSVVVSTFGIETDKPVPADYTGDGAADIAVWRPSTGEWFILRSENASYYSLPFGTNGDIPAPGDYDGDGRTDTAVFRPSTGTWYINQTTRGLLIANYGVNGDQPIPASFVR